MAVQQANRSNDGNKPQDQGPRTSSFVGMLVVIVVVLTLNWLVFPKMSGQRIIPTDYGTFINKVDSGLVEKVMIKNDYIYFLTDEGDNGKTTYSTGSVGDPGLVDRLLAAKSPNEDGRIAFTRPDYEFHPAVGPAFPDILPDMETGRKVDSVPAGSRRQCHVLRRQRGQDLR